MASSVSISGSLGPALGTVTIGPLTITGSGKLQSIEYLLANSWTTIAVPTWATGVIIQPDPANTHQLSFKMLNGDTGANISPTSATCVALDNAHLPSNIYLESSASDSTYTIVTFF